MPAGRITMHRPLRCRADGSFTIVQFTDTHFGNGEAEDDRTTALMDRVLDLEQPDLVVFTGDVLGGQRGTKNARAAWARATAPLLARDLRWCAVFG
ncbi:MAG: metallophosphoesterase, partial [Opitutae bacterium]|nr:metallophosphoesterase [Opitutae bacterium]